MVVLLETVEPLGVGALLRTLGPIDVPQRGLQLLLSLFLPHEYLSSATNSSLDICLCPPCQKLKELGQRHGGL